ncbi:MAG: alpha/beta fold hydrolase [Acidimicrobiia bacterium]
MTEEQGEFSMLADNVEDAGLPWRGAPRVERRDTSLADGRVVSSIVWGADPQLVFFHGGGQNAHTWDTVVLAMGLDALAVDLPGHGHSPRDPAAEAAIYDPVALADDVAGVVRSLAPNARLVTGMSLGGLVSIVLAARHPDLVERVAVVDVTPGVTLAKASTMGPAAGPAPESWATLDEIVERTVGADPARVPRSLRRGVIHNTRQLPNGRWVWRHDRHRRDDEGYALGADGSRVEPGSPLELPGTANRDPDAFLYPELWDDVSAIAAPILLVLGSRSGVVDEADTAELLRRRPGARVVTVDDAGHRVQGDKPVELAAVLADFLAG